WQFLYAVPAAHLPAMYQLAASQDAKVSVIGGITEREEIAVRHSDGAWHQLERLEHDSFADDGNGAGHFSRTGAATARRGVSLEGRHYEALWRELF
ncbi:MAG: hypothetical protein KDK08_24305, partial [Rhizobiaceae bacterium]|nr:hypothetical protein [Rhizobiaceae bacterium]